VIEETKPPKRSHSRRKQNDTDAPAPDADREANESRQEPLK
jgi:hypothetical protein